MFRPPIAALLLPFPAGAMAQAVLLVPDRVFTGTEPTAGRPVAAHAARRRECAARSRRASTRSSMAMAAPPTSSH